MDTAALASIIERRLVRSSTGRGTNVSETDRAPFIRLSVDQEVFIDTVRESDTIDDANVATEVTSFDRVGDAYVLEGAIVFAGYLTRSDASSEQIGADADALSFGFDDGEYVQHVHHRMPFVLRVPVKSQQRGIVNVASRIAGWKLSVISAGWIRVVADLNIVGLNGNDGYHFQCGAQEEGDIFFGKEWLDTTVSPESPVVEREEQILSAGAASSLLAQEFQLTRGSEDESQADESELQPKFQADSGFSPALANPAPVDQALQAKLSALSDARGGHQEPQNGFEGQGEWVTSGESATKDELANLDRFLNGPQAELEPLEKAAAFNRAGTPDGAPEERADAIEETYVFDNHLESTAPHDNQGEQAEPVAEFEFEHQISSSELLAEPPMRPSDGAFVASRSFSEDGFHATSGFAPNVTVSSQATYRGENTDERPSWYDNAGTADGDMPYLSEMSPVDTSLWSFVDLSVPDRYYTLRFAIVMDEETLDAVSERLACTKTDLIRVNRLSSETVIPGQTLKIPQTKMVVSR